MAHTITKPVTKEVTLTTKNTNQPGESSYPRDVHALEAKVTELQAIVAEQFAAIEELQTIVAALA